ncbi:C40 family peptidase [Dermacoccus abyssi]|uniref:C40 family peptidase n=1 Tax=Dermacoccus sp. PAMC28757 TaxID=2762331 RepID=UPI00164CF10D|nr:C40 family peptidase [Dermacoccus sp. PAMC28757]QNK52067.1 C40 family peptidase [Dermacoccus sp. PAMC28757]
MKNMSRRSFMANTSKVAVGTALASTALGAVSVASASNASAVTSASARRAVAKASSRRGAPYVYGASGPWRFDCSGLTSWSYRQVGRYLPRTANQQYRSSYRVSRAYARPGDLAFLTSGGYAYHTGIYAGNGMVWHAMRPGTRVSLSRAGASYRFGRV